VFAIEMLLRRAFELMVFYQIDSLIILEGLLLASDVMELKLVVKMFVPIILVAQFHFHTLQLILLELLSADRLEDLSGVLNRKVVYLLMPIRRLLD